MSDDGGAPEAVSTTPAALVATVLDEEAKRQAAQDAARAETTLPDDLLPGVGAQDMSLREGLRRGGWSIITVLGLLEFVQFFDNAALAVLAPDIQSSLDVSDAVLGAIGGAFGLLFLLGSVPISSLADRLPRTKLAAVSMMVWSVIIFMTGLVVNAVQLFVARMGAGLGQAYSLPVNQPVLIDAYPIEVRGRVFALLQSFSMGSLAVGPVFVGTIAGLAGGDEGWRLVFFVIALLTLPIAISALFLTDPRRGRNEMQAVLGEELEEDEDELPISLSVAFARLKKIRSFHFFLVGMVALGFALFTVPLFLNLFLEDEFGLSAFERGVFGSLTILPAFVAVAFAGRRSDQLFQYSPPRAMVFLGSLVGAFGVFIVGAIYAMMAWAMVSAISQVQSVGQTVKLQVIHAEAMAHARAHGGYPAHVAAINADPNSSRAIHVFVTEGFDEPAPGEVTVGAYDLADWNASPTSKAALLAAIEGLDTSRPCYAFGDFWFVRIVRPTNEADLVFAWSYDPGNDMVIFITDDGTAVRAPARDWEDYWAADRDARVRLGLSPFEPPAGSGPPPAVDDER